MVGNRLYIGNLSSGTTENDLANLFNGAGLVLFTAVPKDERTGNLKNYGFVSMGSPEAGQAAIKSYHGHTLRQSTISVRVAEDREV
jgi:RNA recognition motif-containing protein